MKEEERLVFPHHTAQWMKLSIRIFSAIVMSSDYIKNKVIPWWEDNLLDMCGWLEENDKNEEYLIDVFNSLEVVFELICKSMNRTEQKKNK